MSQRTSRFRLNSIIAKVAGVIILVVGIVAGTLSFLTTSSFQDYANEELLSRARGENIQLANEIAGPVKFGLAEKVDEILVNLLEHAEGQIIGAVALSVDGSFATRALESSFDDSELRDMAETSLASGESILSEDGYLEATPVFFGDEPVLVGVVVTRWSPELTQTDIRGQTIFAAKMAGLIFLVAVGAAVFLMHKVLSRPLGSVATVIEAFGHKDYEIDAPLAARGDEIGDIGRSLEELRKILAHGKMAELESTLKSAAFTGSSASMLLVDQDMRVTHANPSMISLFRKHLDGIRLVRTDFDPDSLIGKTVEAFHGAGHGGTIREQMRKQGDATFRTTVRFGDARISLTVSAIRDVEGTHVGYVLEWSDVTQSWLNNALIEAIDASQLKAEFSVDGRFLSANALFTTAIGLTVHDLRSRSFEQLLFAQQSGSRDHTSIMAQTIQSGAFLGTITLTNQSGGKTIVDGSLSCVKDHEGKPIRLLLLGKDITVAETELQSAKEQRALAEEQQSAVVEALRLGLRKLNSGDLTARIEDPFSERYEELRRDYNETVRNLSKSMLEIAVNAENISSEAHNISATADNLSRRTESTAATLEETAAALDGLTTSLKSTADGAAQADQAVTEAKERAEDSGKVVIETVSAMDQIASSSDKITSIIKVIDDIAFQTNLLALNAGVEAARAGDAGRGFAVVASEVRALAQRSSDAAREINGLIASSATQVKRGVDLVGKTGDALHQIAGSVTQIAGLVSSIAVNSRQQSANLVEINSALNQLDQTTQQNAARLEETTAASEGLTKDAVALVEIVSHFKVDREDSGNELVIPFRQNRNKPAAPQRDTTMSRPVARVAGGAPAAAVRPAASSGWEDF
jgi:methyl-accepting chemotaxis protein